MKVISCMHHAAYPYVSLLTNILLAMARTHYVCVAFCANPFFHAFIQRKAFITSIWRCAQAQVTKADDVCFDFVEVK